MKEDSPTKSSGRAGRFKKKLVSLEELREEAPLIRAKLAPFLELFSSSQLSQVDFTACYILLYLSHRYPGTWPGAMKSKETTVGPKLADLPFQFERNVQKRLAPETRLFDVFNNFALKSTPLSVNRTLLSWKRGDYELIQMFRIPGPREVLEQQIEAKRCVTTICDERNAQYILGERDALSFCLHDLIHADHFYHHNESFEGQLGFYGLLYETFGFFDLSREEFKHEFEYLISDMNAYPIHLLKCLKSAMVHYFNEEHFLNWVESVNGPQELRLMNSPAYNPHSMDQKLISWLLQFRKPSKRHFP